MKTIKVAIIVMLLGIFFQDTFGQIIFREIKNQEDWSIALELAKRENKPLFLDIYATWCGPCKYLEQNIYTDSLLGEYYNEEFINVKMDGESEFGKTRVLKYGLTAYPTMYYLYPSEDILTTLVGVREAPVLKDIGQAISDNYESFERFDERFVAGKLSDEELLNYYSLLLKIEKEDQAARVATGILPVLNENDYFDPRFKSIIINSSTGLDSEAFRIVTKNRGRLLSSWTSDEMTRFYMNVYNAELTRGISENDRTVLTRLEKKFFPVYLGDKQEDLPQAMFITRKTFYANTDNWSAYDSIVNKTFSETEADDKFLYQQAYEVANEYSMSQEALKIASGWMVKAREINPNFENMVLASYLFAMSGQYNQAREYINDIRNLELSVEQQKVIDELEKRISSAENS